MKYTAFIFARGGSKGVKGKNIRLLAGKPLLAWAIEQAKLIKRIERIIVSTDSEEIAAIARKYGAEVPFMRPAELAQDNSPEWLSWQHALHYMQETDGGLPEAMISLPTTSPLRDRRDIENCLDEYEKGDVDVVITMSLAHRNPYFNMVKLDSDKYASLVIAPEKKVFRRQDAPILYDVTTVAYVARPEFVKKQGGVFEGRVRGVQVPVERSLDIDTPFDFQLAEYLMGLKSGGVQ